MEKIWNKTIEALKSEYDWVQDMHGVPQSPVHHAEGDVAIHTQMVLDALTALPGYQALPIAQQQILWMSALLHDVEKRSTTIIDAEGNISSPGHAKKGAMRARHILFREFELDFHSREQVVHLVRYHGLPLWIMEKPDPRKALLEAALHVDMQLLVLLATADIQGRICSDAAELMERIEFFEAYCKEQGVWAQAYEFKTAASRFYFFNNEHALSPDYVPFEQFTCTVTLMSALPGMGKDHYINKHAKDMPVISLDAIRKRYKLKPENQSHNGWAAQYAKEQARTYLRAGKDFVWNATNITKQMRSQLISLFVEYGARVKIIYLERPYKTWQAQNRNREAVLPESVLEQMLYKLEVPALSEAHEVVYFL